MRLNPRMAGLLLAVFLSALPIYAADQSAPDAAYQQSFEKWKAELTDDRKQNWLSLAGLFWLKPGENKFGSDAKNDIVFPKGPAHAGSFFLAGKDVSVKLAPDAHVTVAGKPATDSKLEPDVSGHPTVLDMGSLRFLVIVRGERVGIRLKDTESEAARNFHGLTFFPLDMNYRVTAKFEPAVGKKTVDVPSVLGDTNPTPVAGTVVFQLNGQELRLTDLGGDPANGLFFVFSDPTSKTDTYPGGRFLDTDAVVNGTVVLDFNRAHSPPCAVTPYATCPLAPKENRLSVAIPVGEKYDHTHGHH
ncbi:MAG TPA: DUF1684 domain-containing protein [Candidatus Solibacter sp.]|nr:DUF1684 domain-containing protein [Candidatus Solibacter sp.]